MSRDSASATVPLCHSKACLLAHGFPASYDERWGCCSSQNVCCGLGFVSAFPSATSWPVVLAMAQPDTEDERFM